MKNTPSKPVGVIVLSLEGTMPSLPLDAKEGRYILLDQEGRKRGDVWAERFVDDDGKTKMLHRVIYETSYAMG